MIRLTASALSIGYGDTLVARGIDMEVRAGSVTCLLGPNGIGKTTLFKTLLGLIRPLAGTVEVGGHNLSTLDRQSIARQIAYVPQAQIADFPYTVIDVVVMGRTSHLGTFQGPRATDYEAAMAALDQLGIAALAQRDSTRISGGQRQLVLIARALAQQTRIVLMDEPTASLDLGNRIRVLDQIKTLAADGLAVVMSTHEPEHAFVVADRVAIIGGPHRFKTGPVAAVMTAAELSDLYGTDLVVERTSSGRLVVGARRRSLDRSSAPPAGHIACAADALPRNDLPFRDFRRTGRASDGVLERLQRLRLDLLAGRLGRKIHRLLGEGIDALPGFRCRLGDNRQLCKPGNGEFAELAQFLVSDSRQVLDHGLHIALRDVAGFRNRVDQLRLVQLWHCAFL
jgi:iron complex transport system ATP-binding protein